MPLAYLGGIMARSERYMRDHWAHARGALDAQSLLASARREEAEHVAAQRAAGLDLVAPACTRWEDMLRPLCREGTAVAPGQLARTFETNTFHRQPQVDGPIPPADPAAWFEAFQLPAGAPWVLTLPSPWDFACRARDPRPRTGRAQLAEEVGHALHPVVEAAFRQGARLVRFHDPSIAYRRAAERDAGALAAGLKAAARGHERDCALHLTNGDPFAVPEALEANPLGGLSIEDPGHAPPGGLRLPNGTRLSLAVLRGEESLVEEPLALARHAAELARALGLEPWGITNGWDLDHVPHAIAQRKVAALAQARAAFPELVA